MHYGIANFIIFLAFVGLFGLTYQGKSNKGVNQKPKTITSFKANNAKHSMNTMTLSECQDIHEQIRKEKNDESLYKGHWAFQGKGKSCPVFNNMDKKAFAQLSDN